MRRGGVGRWLRPAPQRVVWLKRDPRTRIEHFPPDRPATHALRAAGIRGVGIDHLVRSYHAGTPISETHLVYIPLSGSVEADCGRGVWKVAPGQKLIAPARGKHWVKMRGGRCDALWVHLGDVPRWQSLLDGGPRVERVQDLEALAHAAREGLSESTSTAFAAADNLAHHCAILVNLLGRELGVGGTGARMQLVERIDAMWRMVGARLGEPWDVGRLARESGVSHGYLHAVMNEVAGLTPMQMLALLRMEKAAALLLNTGLTVAVVAEQVGYGSPYAFSDTFLRYSGLRPGRYRRRKGKQMARAGARPPTVR
ncbi:MAG TPA: AraC family transcriptional regulator [Verrucomicrobiae bacterium]|nr:AraC family transcriptional regulator [Verrucomicrobiae bacterium]